MFTASVENAQGESLILTGDEPRWQVFRITGLNPPKGQINLSEMAGMDGAWFNSSKLDVRNIVIYLKINGDAQTNRLTLYNYFRTKQKLTFFFEHSARSVYIEGYCETVQVSPFDRSQTMQISILCPFPYFRSVGGEIVPFGFTTAQFEFPFSINEDDPIPFSEVDQYSTATILNNSDEDVGMMVTVENDYANDGLRIVNILTGEKFEVDYSFAVGDIVEICTKTGEKTAKVTRSGVVTNLFAYIPIDSTFLQLHPGTNRIEVYAKTSGGSYWAKIGSTDIDKGRYNISFAFESLFRGV